MEGLLGFITREDFLDAMETMFNRLKKLPKFPDADRKREGCYVAVMNITTNKMVLVAEIGNCHPEKAEKYFQFCQEKVRRLAKLHEEQGHISCWQSRNPEEKQYGGGIIIPNYKGDDEMAAKIANSLSKQKWAIAISGMPEHGDEVLLLVASYVFSLLSEQGAKQITDISQNPYFNPLRDVCMDFLV